MDKLNTLETREDRARFIAENESSIYTGKNIDNEEVIVMLQQNEGMIVKTRYDNKPQFLECLEYDDGGFQTSVSYEPYDK